MSETRRQPSDERVLPAGPDWKLLVSLWEDGAVEDLHVMDDVLVPLLDVWLVLDHGVLVGELSWQSVDRAAVEGVLCWQIDLVGGNSHWEKTSRQLGNFRGQQSQSDQARHHRVLADNQVYILYYRYSLTAIPCR